MVRRTIAGALALLALLALGSPALAGGWAVVTLDQLPQSVRAGEAITLGFMVRQHGIHPISRDYDLPQLSARRRADAPGSASSAAVVQAKGEETIEVTARPEGPLGHYVVDVTFPSAGVWEWSITPPPFEGTSFEPLTVQAAAPTSASGITLPVLLRSAGLVLLAAGLAVGLAAWQPRRRRAARLGAEGS